tara:strand:+ start:249 stop:425 length:177 start_codon:yes stop_codon:yes gene_type:complete
MDKGIKELVSEVQVLGTKLTVRNCQYKIAVEGLTTLVESTDPMGIAQKTLDAMEECLP